MPKMPSLSTPIFHLSTFHFSGPETLSLRALALATKTQEIAEHSSRDAPPAAHLGAQTFVITPLRRGNLPGRPARRPLAQTRPERRGKHRDGRLPPRGARPRRAPPRRRRRAAPAAARRRRPPRQDEQVGRGARRGARERGADLPLDAAQHRQPGHLRGCVDAGGAGGGSAPERAGPPQPLLPPAQTCSYPPPPHPPPPPPLIAAGLVPYGILKYGVAEFERADAAAGRPRRDMVGGSAAPQ